LQVPQPLYAALGLATGQCVGAYMTVADLDIAQSRQMLDASCSFIQVGGVVKQYSGAWALQNDFGCPTQDGKTCRCTSFMNQVLTQLFLNLRSSGTMKSDFDDAIASQTDRVCPADVEKDTSLQIGDLRGVFYLYGFCFAICMGFYVCQYHITPVLEKIYMRRIRNDRCDACLGIEVQTLDEAGGGKSQVSGKEYPEEHGCSENQMPGVIHQQPTHNIHEEDDGDGWKYIRSGADSDGEESDGEDSQAENDRGRRRSPSPSAVTTFEPETKTGDADTTPTILKTVLFGMFTEGGNTAPKSAQLRDSRL